MLGMALITSNDVIVKLGSENLGVGQLLFVRGIMAVMIFSCIIKLSGRPLWPRLFFSRWNGCRAVCEGGATFFFVTGLSLLPIATASTLVWISPILLTISAAVILRERVTMARWVAVLVGFLGVVLVTNPFGDQFSWAMVLPIMAALFVCTRDLATRQLDPGLHSMHATYASLILVTGMGGVMSLFGWREMDVTQIGWLGFSALLLGLGFLSQVSAVRLGELSFIAPFAFSGILMSVFYGFMIWDELPSGLMIIGMGLVIGAGVYILSSHKGGVGGEIE